jgi:hypothetical protein
MYRLQLASGPSGTRHLDQQALARSGAEVRPRNNVRRGCFESFGEPEEVRYLIIHQAGRGLAVAKRPLQGFGKGWLVLG